MCRAGFFGSWTTSTSDVFARSLLPVGDFSADNAEDVVRGAWDMRDAFAVDYSTLAKLWEALSPDPMLQAYEQDYRWLSQVYVSVQPTTGRLVSQ